MEGLQYCANTSLNNDSVIFEDERPTEARNGVSPSKRQQLKAKPPFETLEMRHAIVGTGSTDAPQVPAFHSRSHQPASDLGTFFSEQPPGADEPAIPQLKLVRIESEFSVRNNAPSSSMSLRITRSLFERLLAKLEANPWVVWLISSRYDGFHYMRAQNGHADTYFFGFFHSAVVWTFRPGAAARTRAMLITRLFPEHETFYALLSSYAPHLHTPYVPLMAVVLSTMLGYDEMLEGYLNKVNQVEKKTGFSWTGPAEPGVRFDVDALAGWSRASAYVRINVVNLLRHHENCVHALDIVKETHYSDVRMGTEEHTPEYSRSMEEVVGSIHILKMRADSFASYANYIKSRAEAQINVIFSLLSHEDSVSNLRLAEASMAIAAATKHDSSAMKTTAVMTMVFLPATFLAAFFALPLFEWEAKMPVRVNGLELYWVVTLPLTVAVFGVWLLLTRHSWISNIFPGKGGAKDKNV